MSQPLDLEAYKQQCLAIARAAPFNQHIGLETLDIGPGWSKSQVRFRLELSQPAGLLHGGVIASLIDTGFAHAILMTDAFRAMAAEGGHMVTVDLRVKYFRPVSDGLITCECTIPRIGRQLLHAEASVKNEDGKEVARGDSIYMLVRRERLIKPGE